jgi:hypothetical protein
MLEKCRHPYLTDFHLIWIIGTCQLKKKSLELPAKQQCQSSRDEFELDFLARAELSYEGSEPRRAGELQFLSWNRANNTKNMYVKESQIFTSTFKNYNKIFPILGLYHDYNQFQGHFQNLSLGTWFNQFHQNISSKKRNQNFGSFLPNFSFQAEW